VIAAMSGQLDNLPGHGIGHVAGWARSGTRRRRPSPGQSMPSKSGHRDPPQDPGALPQDRRG
jgi:hypothetical protein